MSTVCRCYNSAHTAVYCCIAKTFNGRANIDNEFQEQVLLTSAHSAVRDLTAALSISREPLYLILPGVYQDQSTESRADDNHGQQTIDMLGWSMVIKQD